MWWEIVGWDRSTIAPSSQAHTSSPPAEAMHDSSRRRTRVGQRGERAGDQFGLGLVESFRSHGRAAPDRIDHRR